MEPFAARASNEPRPWARRPARTEHPNTPAHAAGAPAEPAWARRTKWALLTLAVALITGTLFELTRTLVVLSESPVAIITTLPPLPEPDPHAASSTTQDEARSNSSEQNTRSAPVATAAEAPKASDETPREAALRVEELRRLRALLEDPPRPKAAPAQTRRPAQQNLFPGITRAKAPGRSTRTQVRPEQALRVVSGPRVRLIGSDALVEVDVENRLSSRFQRTVALELLVDGQQRQRRRLFLKIPPGSRLHLSERFSTTLPDGTYSARLTVPPFG